jgi:hypothetical protein
MAMWTALSGGHGKPAPKPVRAVTPRTKKQKGKRSQPRAPRVVDARAKAKALFQRRANDNVVVNFPAA